MKQRNSIQMLVLVLSLCVTTIADAAIQFTSSPLHRDRVLYKKAPASHLVSNESQPITIVATDVVLVPKAGLATYTGNVKILQGDTKLTADRVTVFTKGNQIIKAIAYGMPAVYEAPGPHGNARKFFAKANTITYLVSEKFIILEGDAMIRQAPNALRAPIIQYDIAEGMVKSLPIGEERTMVTLRPDEYSSLEQYRNKEND